MKRILCLSGWGQNPSSLEPIFKHEDFRGFDVSSLPYSHFDNLETLFSFIKSENPNPEILVGWSLGGQLSLRLIEQKLLSPKLLILFAPPFQMVKDEKIQAAMPRIVFEEFYRSFVHAPDKTLKRFSILTAMNDHNASDIAKNLEIGDHNSLQLKFWLEELEKFSCFNLDFSNMPRTLYFHGKGDSIVHISQADYFKERLKDLRINLLDKCGHAPHLNDIEMIRKTIKKELNEV